MPSLLIPLILLYPSNNYLLFRPAPSSLLLTISLSFLKSFLFMEPLLESSLHSISLTYAFHCHFIRKMACKNAVCTQSKISTAL